MLIDLFAMATFTSSPVKIHNWHVRWRYHVIETRETAVSIST